MAIPLGVIYKSDNTSILRPYSTICCWPMASLLHRMEGTIAKAFWVSSVLVGCGLLEHHNDMAWIKLLSSSVRTQAIPNVTHWISVWLMVSLQLLFYIISWTLHILYCVMDCMYIADSRNCCTYYSNVLISPVCRYQSWLLAALLTRIQKLPSRPVWVCRTCLMNSNSETANVLISQNCTN